MLAGFGVNPVEFGADILPANAYQNITFEIDYAYGNVGKLIEIVHKGLNRPGINDISKLKVYPLWGRRENALQF